MEHQENCCILKELIRLAYSLHPKWGEVELRTRAGHLSSTDLVPEAWGIPQEPPAFIPCWKAEDWVLISSRDGCSVDSDSGRSSWEMNSPARLKSKQAKIESCSHWASSVQVATRPSHPDPHQGHISDMHIRYFHCHS